MLQKLDVQVSLAESSNLPFNLGIAFEVRGLWNVPYPQEGIRCKVPRSDELTVWAVRRRGSGPEALRTLRVLDSLGSETGEMRDRRQRCRSCPCESRDDALLVEQGRFF